MEKIKLWVMTITITMLVSSCAETTKDKTMNSEQNDYRYNICLVLDGSDRLSKQNEVPQVSIEQVVDLAKTLATNGTGSLYVSFVDANAQNNKIASFDWWQKRPSKLGEKPGYMKISEYEKAKSKSEQLEEKYTQDLVNATENFSRDCSNIIKLAYSDEVAKHKNGSDVNGAINQAIRLLRASEHQTDFSYIILVSDGCDNVGRELSYFPRSTELLIVNSCIAKHQYEELVSREFVTLKQALNYIFD